MMLDDLLLDFRYGARMLYRNAGFTAVAVFALGLGIGINTAVFTAYKAMVARPLDARDPGSMVNMALLRDSSAPDYVFSYPDYLAYRDSLHSISGLIAFEPEQMRLSHAGVAVSQRSDDAQSGLGRLGLLPSRATTAEFASVFTVSEDYFKVLGVAAVRGRTFDAIPASELTASPPVLMSENYWERRFGGDPAILGKTVRLNDVAVTIVGITPRDFVATSIIAPDFWAPLTLAPLVHADAHWLSNRENNCCRLFARLAPHATIAQVQAEVTLVAGHLAKLHDPHSDAAKPATALVWPGSPFPLPLKMLGGLVFTIVLIMAAAAMVLVIACANVGSLQLARARSRENELRTRLSLGAGRFRIVRQLLTESALLAVCAGAVALLFTWTLLKLAVRWAADAFPAQSGTAIFDVNPDLQTFAYVLAISVLAGVLFGVVPALESSGSAIVSGARNSTSRARSRRVQDFLLAAQVALSAVLLIAGSMLIRSSLNSLKMDTGYDAKHGVELDLQFPEGAGYTATRKLALVRQVIAKIAVLPGVTAITSARSPGGFAFRTAAAPVDAGKSHGRDVHLLHYTYVQPNFFETLNVPVLLGRGFAPEGDPSRRSVIVSQSAARQLWQGENPIGRSLRLGAVDEKLHNRSEIVADGPAYQVIGVAGDTRSGDLNGGDSRLIYLPLTNDRIVDRPILIRTRSSPEQVDKQMDAIVSGVDPNLIATSATLVVMLRMAPAFIASTMSAAVASAIGLLGLVLAMLGIYGTVAYIVVLRTREIGIRMAVGAQKHHILRQVLTESARPVIFGLVVGMILATGASYLLHGVLYGLSTVDPVSFLGVSLMFLVIALLAAYPPSRRAMRVDPMVALRYE